MAGVFDIELHDVDETVEITDSDDDVIEVEEVNSFTTLLVFHLVSFLSVYVNLHIYVHPVFMKDHACIIYL